MAGYTTPSIIIQQVWPRIGSNETDNTKNQGRSDWFTSIEKDLTFEDVFLIGVSFGDIFGKTYYDARWRDFKTDDREGYVAFTATLWCDTGMTYLNLAAAVC